jgi:hypothetical protein
MPAKPYLQYGLPTSAMFYFLAPPQIQTEAPPRIQLNLLARRQYKTDMQTNTIPNVKSAGSSVAARFSLETNMPARTCPMPSPKKSMAIALGFSAFN